MLSANFFAPCRILAKRGHVDVNGARFRVLKAAEGGMRGGAGVCHCRWGMNNISKDVWSLVRKPLIIDKCCLAGCLYEPEVSSMQRENDVRLWSSSSKARRDLPVPEANQTAHTEYVPGYLRLRVEHFPNTMTHEGHHLHNSLAGDVSVGRDFDRSRKSMTSRTLDIYLSWNI